MPFVALSTARPQGNAEELGMAHLAKDPNSNRQQ